MTERVWHKGPPPHVGWWNASVQRDEDAWRWWDGDRWSLVVYSEYTAAGAANEAKQAAVDHPIEWTDYWPENARVPRLDPTGGHWTFNVDGQEPKDIPPWIDIVLRDQGIWLNVDSRAWIWSLDDNGLDILAWRPAA